MLKKQFLCIILLTIFLLLSSFTYAFECNDGIDNDGDGKIDYFRDGGGTTNSNPDPGCSYWDDDEEEDPPLPFCGTEVECFRSLYPATGSTGSFDCSTSSHNDVCFQIAGDSYNPSNGYYEVFSDTTCCAKNPISGGVNNACVYNGVILAENGDYATNLGNGDDNVALCYQNAWIDLDQWQASSEPASPWNCWDAGFEWINSW